jgi:hypothetical protein
LPVYDIASFLFGSSANLNSPSQCYISPEIPAA